LNVERAEREAHTKSRRKRQNFCCNFFATPTRLADGLGTKKLSPRLFGLNASPRFSRKNEKSRNFWFPRVVSQERNNFGDQLFNKKILSQQNRYFQDALEYFYFAENK
jgi:hypothetical protein